MRTPISLALLAATPALAPGQESETHDFEVLVLGTLHAPFQFRHPDFTPAHVEAALAACEPDVIGVESNPTWFARGEYYPVTYEAQGVAVPYAERRGIPVYGVDWMDIESWDRRVEETARRRHGGIAGTAARGPLSLGMFGEIPDANVEELDAYFRNPELGFANMNGVGDGAGAGKWLPPGEPTDPGWGGERNQRIFRRCLEVMEAHPGERLAVVIGGGHKEVLDGLFGTVEGVKLLKLGEDVPVPDEDALDAAWTMQHLVATLGHNLDGERTYFHPELVDLPRMRGLVERLKGIQRGAALATYYRGRIQYMEGNYGEALKSFQALHEVFGQREPYPFPMDHWRMRYGWAEAISLEEARTLLALGRREEAAEILARIPRRLPEVPELEPIPGSVSDVLTDAGFEEGRIERAPTAGWYSDDVLAGSQRASLDAESPHGGEHSLEIEVLRDREHGYSSLTQTVAITQAMREAGELELSVFARADGIPHLRLVAYRWEDGRGMVELEAGSLQLTNEWREGRVGLEVPDDVDEIHFFLYYPGRAGGTIWFDDARLFEEQRSAIPEEWVPRTLAREFVRTLLEEE